MPYKALEGEASLDNFDDTFFRVDAGKQAIQKTKEDAKAVDIGSANPGKGRPSFRRKEEDKQDNPLARLAKNKRPACDCYQVRLHKVA